MVLWIRVIGQRIVVQNNLKFPLLICLSVWFYEIPADLWKTGCHKTVGRLKPEHKGRHILFSNPKSHHLRVRRGALSSAAGGPAGSMPREWCAFGKHKEPPGRLPEQILPLPCWMPSRVWKRDTSIHGRGHECSWVNDFDYESTNPMLSNKNRFWTKVYYHKNSLKRMNVDCEASDKKSFSCDF